jgi:L-threonylcarbamoyladenylate synthase
MQTELITVNPADINPELIGRAAALIQQGGLVAFPTETVYGLGANALDQEAVERIFTAKGRPANDPIIVHIAHPADLTRLTAGHSELALKLAQTFWPGPLTLVLPKAEIVPLVVTAGQGTVAVRCPQHPVAQALIRSAQTPIAAPSANRFSHTSPTTAQHVWDDLSGRINLIVDGGPSAVGVESTVLDLTSPIPAVLRPGGVPIEALTQLIGYVKPPQTTTADENEPLVSPGLLSRHYAPKTELRLFTGPTAEVRIAMQKLVARELANDGVPALLLATEDIPYFPHPALKIGNLGSENDLETVAHNLFKTLRQLDTADVTLILARDFPPHGLGLAIRDRLRRAAQQIVEIE